MKLAIAGAGLIIRTFMEMVHDLDIELTAICARPQSLKKLETFKQEHQIKRIYTDYEEMLRDPEIDTVYVAVNNHLHYLFARKAVEAGMNVIVEKPFTSNYKEAEDLAELAKSKHVFIFEAISTIHNPNYLAVKRMLPELGDIKIVTLNYSQYSSRYDAFMKGEILPAFDYRMSGGSLMDLNVYNIHFIVGLFGSPFAFSYLANRENNIDTSGILTLDYGSFKAVLIGAKDSYAPFVNAIQGNKGALYSDCPLFTFTHFEKKMINAEAVYYDERIYDHRMKQEFSDFIRILKDEDYNECLNMLNHSLKVMAVLDKARKNAGIVFPADDI